MAEPIVNFESSINDDNDLVLKDTTDYGGTVVSNRYWVLTKSDGQITALSHPIIEGATLTIPIDKDYAYIIKLALNYNPTTNTEGYKKEKNVLVAPFLSGIIYDLRKKFQGLLLENEREEKARNLLEKLEFIDAYMEAAIRLLSTDVLASQQALDFGNDYGNEFKCEL